MSASSGRTPQVMEALANAERTSQRVLDELRRSVADAEDNLAEADMQLRRSMADAADLSEPEPDLEFDLDSELQQPLPSSRLSRMQRFSRLSGQIGARLSGRKSSNESPQGHESRLSANSAATRLEAAVRSRSARRNLRQERAKEAEQKREKDAQKNENVRQAQQAQQFAREKLEKAQAAVREATERLLTIQKQQNALAQRRRSVSEEEYSQIQRLLKIQAEKEAAERARRLEEEERRREEERRKAEMDDEALLESLGAEGRGGMMGAVMGAMTSRGRRGSVYRGSTAPRGSVAPRQDRDSPPKNRRGSIGGRRGSVTGRKSVAGVVMSALTMRGDKAEDEITSLGGVAAMSARNAPTTKRSSLWGSVAGSIGGLSRENSRQASRRRLQGSVSDRGTRTELSRMSKGTQRMLARGGGMTVESHGLAAHELIA